jgi:hypothetical protein
MFYQHYLSALASGMGCLSVTLYFKPVIWAQMFFALSGAITSGFYLSQVLGDETENFEGTVLYPKAGFNDLITITAQNQTPYDTSLGYFVGDITLTFVELVIQNFLMNFTIPLVIINSINHKESKGVYDPTQYYNCSVGPRVALTVIGVLIVLVGTVQGFLSWYFLFGGTLLLAPITNLNYMLYFTVAAGIVPPLRHAKPPAQKGEVLLEGKKGLRRVDEDELSYYHNTRFSAYNVLYIMGLFLTWLTIFGSLMMNINWSQDNNLGGAVCTPYSNVTRVLAGEQTLRFYTTQHITYGNLSYSVGTTNLVALQELNLRTQNNIKAVWNFSCVDLWMNWSLFALFTVFFILHCSLYSYDPTKGGTVQPYQDRGSYGSAVAQIGFLGS